MNDRTNDYEALADELASIAEAIAEHAVRELKAAVRRGEQKRPDAERTLTQARRAVEKAAHLLRHVDADGAASAGTVDSDG